MSTVGAYLGPLMKLELEAMTPEQQARFEEIAFANMRAYAKRQHEAFVIQRPKLSDIPVPGA